MGVNNPTVSNLTMRYIGVSLLLFGFSLSFSVMLLCPLNLTVPSMQLTVRSDAIIVYLR